LQLIERHSGATMPPTTQSDAGRLLAQCQERIGYRFRELTLLQEALTHASGANHRLASNERLEFLGDAVLGTIVCELLFRKFPHYLEGDLTRIKSSVVSSRTCAKISAHLGIEDFLITGKGMGSPAQTPASVLADVFESLIGAIYLDRGMEAAREFVIRHLRPEIATAVDEQGESNYKSNLQQVAQREYGETPSYLLLDEKGPDHSKCFKISAKIGQRRYASAWGRTKKEAEQRAALNALCQLSGEPLPYESD
jgi:ribonuclease-3